MVIYSFNFQKNRADSISYPFGFFVLIVAKAIDFSGVPTDFY
jgi:hypothetical protein